MTTRLVFDIESVGLHGEGFAVGWVLTDEKGKVLEEGYTRCPLQAAKGDDDDRAWVQANVIPHLDSPSRPSPSSVREWFWGIWRDHKDRNSAQLWADCAWPVEANFLRACVADDPGERKWEGPYPFFDVSTLLLAAGMDPLGTYPRLPGEHPAHHPLMDARQSARLITEAMAKLSLPAASFARSCESAEVTE